MNWKKLHNITALLFCVLTVRATAQSEIDVRHLPHSPAVFAGAEEYGNPVEMIYKEMPAFRENGLGLMLSNTKQTRANRIYTYQLEKNGIPVYGTYLKLVENENLATGRLVFPGEMAIPASFEKVTGVPETAPQVSTREVVKKEYYNYYRVDGEYKLCRFVEISPSATEHMLYVYRQGEPIETKDLLCYRATDKDTVANGYVFLPDPLTSSQTTYGQMATDSNDLASPFLDNQRKQVSIPVTFTSADSFVLENEHVKIMELSNPVVPPQVLSTDDFLFDRSQPGFEEVNALYHITKMKGHLAALGYPDLVNYQVQVDVHGFNGSDQSSFNWLKDPPQLVYGDGGVDDAEDADVILHEFGHAILHAAAPDAKIGGELESIQEGVCDYFAVSYSRAIDPFNWHRVFNWDGHNEFWPGRVANSAKIYPEDFKNNLYQDAVIWSSALMEIWEHLGRDITDEILLESLHSYVNEMTMQDAARLFIEAETDLFGGQYRNTICQVFNSRGLIQECHVSTDEATPESAAKPFLIAGEGQLKLLNAASTGRKQTTISVYDLAGRVVIREKITPVQAHSLPHNLTTGIYLYEIASAKTAWTGKVFIP